MTGLANPATAGTASNFTVSAYDQYGNVATGYSGTIHLTSSDSQAVLPGNYTFTTNDAGVHTFSATLKTSGVQSITATDTATASIMASELNISVKPAAAYSLTVTGLANPATAGTASNFTVTAYDQYGNVATGYSGTIHLTSSDSQSVVPGNYTFTTNDAGVHTFSATLKTAGMQSITATDTATASIMGSELNIGVKPAAAYSLTVTGLANPATAGTASNFTVSAYDQYGNVATGYAGTIHFTSGDSQAMLPSNYTFTTGDAGPYILGDVEDSGRTIDHSHRHVHVHHHRQCQCYGERWIDFRRFSSRMTRRRLEAGLGYMARMATVLRPTRPAILLMSRCRRRENSTTRGRRAVRRRGT